MSRSAGWVPDKYDRHRVERADGHRALMAEYIDFCITQREDEEYERELQYMEFDEDRYEDSVIQHFTDLGDGECKHPYYWETIDWESRRNRLG